MSSHPYTRLFPRTTAPTADDDDSLGFEVGDVWIDQVGGNVYHAVDVTDGAAVWSSGSGSFDLTPYLSNQEVDVNGGFDTDDGWTFGTGWSWNAGGYAEHTPGDMDPLYYAGLLIDQAVYYLEAVVGGTAGSVNIGLDDSIGFDVPAGAGFVFVSAQWVNNNGHKVHIIPSSDFDGTIDEVTLFLVNILQDAPFDGPIYGRGDGDWTALGDAALANIGTGSGEVAEGDHTHSDIPSSYLDTDGTLAANSDAKIATQKATKTYVDNAVTGLLDFRGSTDCSANPNYPAASKGDAYVVSVAGKIGGASGKSVEVGDVYVASADNAGGTEASVGTSWFVLEHNLQGALLAANNLSDVANPSTARSNLGLAIGSQVQAYDAELAALAGLASAADKLPYFTGSGTAGLADLTSFIRTLLDDANQATAQVTLGLVPGTNVQAYDAELAALAGLTSAADKLPYFTGSGSAALTDLSSFVRTLLDETSIANFLAVLNIAWGQYTPTLDNTTNVAASTVSSPFNYIRIGNVVIGGGGVTVDPTTTGNTVLGISLPVASDFTTSTDATGNGTSQVNNMVGNIGADATNNRMTLTFQAAVNTNQAWRVLFIFEVK
jgi:hypothetical protein